MNQETLKKGKRVLKGRNGSSLVTNERVWKLFLSQVISYGYPLMLVLVTIFLTLLSYTEAVNVVYATNYHTVVNIETEYQTEAVTKWTTVLHSEEPTTTVTSTLTTYTTLQSQFTSEALFLHNAKRQLHQNTPELLWSDEIAVSAQSYADFYNCNGTLVHSRNAYGENLALGYNTTAAITAWYDEIKNYDYNYPIFGETTGHFTQLVWKSTAKVGCGYKWCDSYYGQYTVCQYESAGNVKDQFQTNVMPLK